VLVLRGGGAGAAATLGWWCGVVWVLLPRQDARPLSRELLYTAVTRARSALHLCASESVLRAALGRHAVRVSGLARRLR